MSTKLFAVMWHWIESDGLCGIFTTIDNAKKAAKRITEDSLEGTRASIHEIKVDEYHKEEPEEIE